MDNPPVSAFAMYSANKKGIKNKKKKNKANKNSLSPKVLAKNLKDDVLKELGAKLKKKQKHTKEPKNITKKKLHKKKKSKRNKLASPKKVASDTEDDDYEDIPRLVRAPAAALPAAALPAAALPAAALPDDGDISVSSCSHSSEGMEFTPVITDSCEEGLKVFKWMVAPFDPDEFLTEVWEKKPLHIARKKSHYYKDIISTPDIDNMLRTENIQFTKNIDITSYKDGQRETHNPEGRAHPHLVWDYYLNGCSVRLLNPQTYIPKLHLLNATLQEFFHSFVGANAYLTPPDSQGFAPHYDDIEAFILQAEGKKKWRIYKPRDDSEVLPRESSKNFSQEEIGEPIMEVVLEGGDLLYFPRGYIHQGVTIDGEHSLHVTVSMYQKQSWADLFEKMLPAALQIAINENIDFRKGLPFDLSEHFGLIHSDVNTPRKFEITEIVHKLFDKIKSCLPIDEAVDQVCKKFQQDALPPVLSDLEKAVTVYGDTDVMVENGQVINRVELSLDTNIRLLRKNIIRMVSEDQIRIYYHAENSLEYHGSELPFLEISEDLAPAIETLITTYPNYVSIENLDIAEDTDKLTIADALWSRGLIMTEYPLFNIDDD